ncbi:glycosyltransferase family 4 protein [Dyadobacter bucti]|uniref:glycosyltransferase family 4 protein n=1 Tax=Dyadobacter bucti TaxID=2572203 RepID=UPI001109193D|nr:glycosyltransferase family 4 protein [Dyadobacter bucti]
MEKILIISYRFPPADETGTQRTWALAKYLKEFGYYPIFVTRNWGHPLKSLEDLYVPVGERIEHEIHENYELHTLPYKNILKLRINKNFKNKHSYIRKAFNLLDYILMYFGIFQLNEFRSFIEQASKIVSADPSIKKALVITDPYPLFYTGFYLNKKFGVKWIADYRDDWNTREVSDTYNFKPTRLHKLVQWITSKMEKKWVKTASVVTSVSDEYTNRISRFVSVPGVTIYNGFFEEDYNVTTSERITNTPPTEFTIVHNGSLYPQQNIEIFLNGFKRTADEYKNIIHLNLKFIGVTYKPGSKERIAELLRGYEPYYTCTDRIPKEELFKEIDKSQIALLISFGKNFKGLTTSKIFDYVAMQKPVLCCPSDGDVVEEILTETGLGFFCDNEDEVYAQLSSKIEEYIKNGKIMIPEGLTNITKYSRRNQTKKVAALMADL